MSDLPNAKRQRRAPSDSTTRGAIINDDDSSSILILPDAVLDSIFSFVGNGNYRYIAGTNRHFRRVYEGNRNRNKDTLWAAAAASVSCAKLVMKDYKLLEKDEFNTVQALDSIFLKAISLGNVDVLEWGVRRKGVKVRFYHFYTVGTSGHITVLEWLDSINIQWEYPSLFGSAAEAGNVHVFEWILSSNGLHYDALMGEDCNNKERVWEYAARGGHVAVLEWMKKNSLIPTDDDGIWRFASSGGCVNVLDWLVENGYEVPPNDDPVIVNSGAEHGHLPVLQWCQDHGFTFTAAACAYAARWGHLAALQWLRENDCPWDGRVVTWAERAWPHADHVVEWARANGCPEPEPEEDD